MSRSIVSVPRAANQQVNRLRKDGGYRALNMRTCAPNELSVRACVRVNTNVAARAPAVEITPKVFPLD